MKFQNRKWSQLVLSALLSILLNACIQIQQGGLVVSQRFPYSRIWINNEEVEIIEMNNIDGRNRHIQFFHDSASGRTWAWNRELDNQHFFIADISDGFYSKEKELVFDSPANEQPVSIYCHGNTAIVKYTLRHGLYGILDLEKGEQKIIDIKDSLTGLNMNNYIIGFDGNFILYNNGYFDIVNNKFKEYAMQFNRPALIETQNILIAADKKNNLLLKYDYINENYETITINRWQLNMRDYMTVFINDNAYYFALASFRSNFNFLSQPSQRNWFRYDTKNKKVSRLSMPSHYVNIIGAAP